MQSRVFSWLWAVALLLDFLCQPFGGQPYEVMTLLLAAFFACRPDLGWVFLVVCVADLTHFLIQAPWTPNHAVLRAFVDLVVLGHFFLRGKPGALEASKPTIRLLLILVYGISVFHKLNHDFLNPEVSCASQMLTDGALWLRLPSPPPILRAISIWGALACEMLIPILLLLPRSYPLALWLGLAFHSILALHPHPGIYSFSGLVIAILSLWVPEEQWSDFIARFGEKSELLLRVTARLAVIFATCAVLLEPHPRWTFRIGLAVWFSLAAAGLLTLFRLRRPGSAERQTLFRLGWAPSILLLVFALNGFAPYMGLHTVRVFSMFSNLRTEGGAGNHLWISTDKQWFSFQSDLVKVLESTDPRLSELAMKEEMLVFFELQRWAQSAPKPFDVKVRRRDGSITTETDATLPPLNPILRKFLFFRAVNKTGPSKCKW